MCTWIKWQNATNSAPYHPLANNNKREVSSRQLTHTVSKVGNRKAAKSLQKYAMRKQCVLLCTWRSKFGRTNVSEFVAFRAAAMSQRNWLWHYLVKVDASSRLVVNQLNERWLRCAIAGEDLKVPTLMGPWMHPYSCDRWSVIQASRGQPKLLRSGLSFSLTEVKNKNVTGKLSSYFCRLAGRDLDWEEKGRLQDFLAGKIIATRGKRTILLASSCSPRWHREKKR